MGSLLEPTEIMVPGRPEAGFFMHIGRTWLAQPC